VIRGPRDPRRVVIRDPPIPAAPRIDPPDPRPVVVRDPPVPRLVVIPDFALHNTRRDH
jgi:hypothetical protein